MKPVVFLSTLLALFLCAPLTPAHHVDPTGGTTKHLKEIFLGRCWDFQKWKAEEDKKDCDNLWRLFSKSFAFKDSCKLTAKDYEEYFVAAIGKRIDKILLQSGCEHLASVLADSGKRFVRTEDTLEDYMVNDLMWCGQVSGSASGMNSDWCACPPWGAGTYRNSSPYWYLASATFGEQARGVATILLNGTRGNTPAYSPESFVGFVQLPMISVHKVEKINILVAHDIGKTRDESCGEKSILELQKVLRARGFEENCYDSPSALKHILCIDHPLAKECSFGQQPITACPKPFGVFDYAGSDSEYLLCENNKAKVLPCPRGLQYVLSPPAMKKLCN